MAGFEVVVRPVVFPNIRPASARSLPPQDDPTKGFAVIKGNGAKAMTLTESFNMSMSKSHQVETERRVDEVRVYQQDDGGTINRNNFVDLEVANRIKTRGGKQPTGDGRTAPGVIGGEKGSKGDSFETAVWYARQIEKENIEIKKRDQIKKNEGATE